MAPPSEPQSNARSHPIILCSDTIDYIFSFLRCDSESLLACSEAHPSFTPIVERHLYYYITLSGSSKSRSAGHDYCLKASHLFKILSDTPRIANHVHVLQIVFGEIPDDTWDDDSEPSDEEDALGNDDSMVFPALETFLFTSKSSLSWQEIPQGFKSVVESFLSLPTLHSIHIDAQWFPLSILDNNPNVDCLSLSGSLKIPKIPNGPDGANAYPQLKSLIIKGLYGRFYASFWNWAKQRIFKLQSLQCDYSNEKNKFLEALEICSGTLNDLDLKISSPYTTTCYLTGEPYDNSSPIPLINLSSLPHLQHLTVRVDVNLKDNAEYTDFDEYIQELCASCLPPAVKILKTASSLQHLTIEICNEDGLWRSIDFSSLAELAESASLPHIDLYITNTTHNKVVSKLVHYDSLRKWIEQGVLVIHAEETAPGTPQFIY